MLATHLTRTEYVFQAGAAFFGVNDGPRNKDDVDFAMMPAASGYNGCEFHAWFVRKPNGARRGEICRVSLDDEFVDLSLRHIPAMAANPTFGERIEWKRTKWPDYFWGRMRDLAALKVRFEVDARVLEEILKEENWKLVESVVRRALAIIKGSPLPPPRIEIQKTIKDNGTIVIQPVKVG